MAMGIGNANARILENDHYTSIPATQKQRKYLSDIVKNRSYHTGVGLLHMDVSFLSKLGFPMGDTIKHYQDAIETGIGAKPETFVQDLAVATWIKEKGISGRELTEDDYEAFVESKKISPLDAMRAAVTAFEDGRGAEAKLDESSKELHRHLSGHDEIENLSKSHASERPKRTVLMWGGV